MALRPDTVSRQRDTLTLRKQDQTTPATYRRGPTGLLLSSHLHTLMKGAHPMENWITITGPYANFNPWLQVADRCFVSVKGAHDSAWVHITKKEARELLKQSETLGLQAQYVGYERALLIDADH